MAKDGKIGFIGGGSMGEALIKGIIGAGAFRPEDVLVSEPDAARVDFLQGEYGVEAAKTNTDLVKRVKTVMLAVKPQVMDDVLNEIEGAVKADQLIVSIAAGVTIKQIQAGLRASAPVVRVMPNTPSLVQAGAAALSPGAFAEAEHMEAAQNIFLTVGQAVVVEEKYLDVVTGLSGSGPAYVFMVLEAMADGAVRMGLARKEARLLAAQTVMGAAKLALESDRHTGELKDMVTSPGGTTAAGLFALEARGVRGAFMEAVSAATIKSRELGKK